MALRTIRVEGDPVLGKICKPVNESNDRLLDLVKDMYETMYNAQGVGLAAPQIGVLKRLCVIDVSEDCNEPICLVNPKIVEFSEEQQTGFEGCLSVPEKMGAVTRAMKVKVEAFNEYLEPIVVEGEGLLARALQHEIDHLDGHLYVEKVEGRLYDSSEFEVEDGEEEK